MTAQFNAKALRTPDIQSAMDLLESHFAAAGRDRAEARSALIQTLTEAGYGLAASLDRILDTYATKQARDGLPPATPETATPAAHEIFSAITGVSLPVAATTPTSALVAAREEASAPEGIPISGIAGITIADPEHLKAIDDALSLATGSQLRSITSLLDAIGAAESTISLQDAAAAAGQEKLAALKAGDLELAASISFEIPAFRPSPLAAVRADGNTSMVDMLLKVGTSGRIPTLRTALEALAAVETAATERAQAIRVLNREIGAAEPRKKFAIAAGQSSDDSSEADAPQCEVVMRRAMDVFKNVRYGGTLSDLLEFDVPTLEWDTPHPDVPAIDDTFRFYDLVLADCLHALITNQIPWVYGEAGSGKSELWYQIAARLGFPLIRLNMDGHLTRGDLVGMNRLVPGPSGFPTTTFIEGVVPRAIKMPSLMLIDEFDLGDPEIMPVLQPVLEGKGIRLLEDGGRYVQPHPWSRIVATANTVGLGSANQAYINVHEQSMATRDRIAMYIEMKYLPPEQELEVVMSRVPDGNEDFARKIIDLANRVREGYRQNEIHQVISTRVVSYAVKHHAHFAPLYKDEGLAIERALTVNIYNRCDPTSHAVVKQLADSIFV